MTNLLVKDVIRGCSTGQIDGLSQQLLERLIVKGYLKEIDHPLIVCEGSHNNPYLQPLALRALVKAVEKVNQRLHINSCLRTIMQQYMLRQQYLNRLCGITAASIPGKSNHQSGLAIDIKDYLFWRLPLKQQGWNWLGSWDRWHFDYAYSGVNLGTIQIKEFQELWNENNPQAKLKVDGIWGGKTSHAVANSPINGFGKPPIFKRGDINKEVGAMQILLRQALNLTKEEFKADCAFGAQTEKAILAFQKQNNLKATGKADSKTLELLGYSVSSYLIKK